MWFSTRSTQSSGGEVLGKFRVRFEPDGGSATVEQGTTILEASRRAGVAMDAVCGGAGECGRCKVRPKGQFRSARSPLVSEAEARAGVVLACKTTVEGDLTVEVLPRSKVGKHQILTKSVAEVPKRLTPWVTKKLVELPKATIEDNIADLERLLRTMGAPHMPVPLTALRALPEAVRKGGWKVTVTESSLDGRTEMCRVEPGDATDRLLGVAIDIGTTTIVVDLVDLLTGKVLCQASDYNKQMMRGEDVIARMMFAEEGGREELRFLVTETVNSAISTLLETESSRAKSPIEREDIVAASVAGNTIMSHLFLGLRTDNVRLEPYVPVAHRVRGLRGSDTALLVNPSAHVLLFPSRAGYVGGDVIADVLSSGMHRSDDLTLLVDVGTNGEVVLGRRDWLVSCSCSAGPAFEGGEVSSGMRAMEGAIDRIRINDDLSTSYHVLGEGKPLGICGSGLIDLIAEMFDHGIIDRKARVQSLGGRRTRATDAGAEYIVEFKDRLGTDTSGDLVVTEADMQNLLRTKAAIYGACSVLLRKTGESLENIRSIVIAGGFGHHLDIERAISIGMFPDVDRKKYRFIGNGALGGARVALLSGKRRREAGEIFEMMTYLELSVDNQFYDEFQSSLFIPHTDIERFPSAKKGPNGEAIKG